MSLSPKKSTNVRSSKSLLAHGYRALDAVSHDAAALLAERLFVLPPARRRDSTRQKELLKQGERFDVTLGSQRLAGWKWGSGPRVLLVHGWGGSAGQLDAFVSALTSAGFSAVAFDAPAHGASPGTELSLPIFASAIERVSSLLGPFHGVITHSLGGPATSLAIRQGLRLARAVFIAPPADAFDWFKKFSIELGLSPSSELATKQRIERRLGIPFEQLNQRALGPHVDVPLLVIHDRLDKQVPWKDGQAVAEAIANAHLLTTEGLGHQRILRNAKVIEEAIAFLKGGSAGQAADLATALATERVSCGHGALVSPESGLCPQCELERELFDRPARWSSLADLPAAAA